MKKDKNFDDYIEDIPLEYINKSEKNSSKINDGNKDNNELSDCSSDSSDECYPEINYNSKLSELLDLKNIKNEFTGLLEEKYSLLYKEKDFEKVLKKEVDSFSEFFNIDSIIAKQEERLKLQEQKMNQLEEFRVLNECIICMENSRNVAFLPCKHFICCDECSFGKIKEECPQCNGKIETKRIIII